MISAISLPRETISFFWIWPSIVITKKNEPTITSFCVQHLSPSLIFFPPCYRSTFWNYKLWYKYIFFAPTCLVAEKEIGSLSEAAYEPCSLNNGTPERYSNSAHHQQQQQPGKGSLSLTSNPRLPTLPLSSHRLCPLPLDAPTCFFSARQYRKKEDPRHVTTILYFVLDKFVHPVEKHGDGVDAATKWSDQLI